MGEEKQKCPTCFEDALQVVTCDPSERSKSWCSDCGTFIEGAKVRIPRRSPFAQSKGLPLVVGEFAPGLLIVAADAVAQANKKVSEIRVATAKFWDPSVWPTFRDACLEAIESTTEALSALIEEVNAQREDEAEAMVDAFAGDDTQAPSRLRDLLARTLRRRRLRT